MIGEGKGDARGGNHVGQSVGFVAHPGSRRMGFWPSKTLLSAVELRLFTVLAGGPLTGEQVGDRLGLHPRAIYDFLDGLVALRFLDRDGNGPGARYRNTVDSAEFLDANKPT